MKRKFTFLIAAAVMLLTMVATTGTMWGQTRDNVTLQYLGSTTFNMVAETNYAANLELDEEHWSVVGVKNDASYMPACNKAHDVRLYPGSGNGSSIIVTNLDGATINSITFDMKLNTPTVKVGGNTVNPTDNVYTINSTSFIVQNGIDATSGNQVQINSITITYTSGGGSTYSVTYNANDATSGDVPVDDNEYDSGDEVTVLGNTGNLAKTGNTWSGWNTLANGTGTTYQADDTFEITENTTLYAKWTPKSITSLAYTGTPNKTDYFEGDVFDPTGLTVTATYNDASSEDVTAQVVWTPNPLTAGTTTVTGTFMEQTVEVGGITVAGANIILNSSNTPFSSTSGSNTSIGTKTLDGIEYQNYGGYNYTSGNTTYLSINKSINGYLGNNTKLCGNISKIVVTFSASNALGKFTMYEGSTALAETTTATKTTNGNVETYTFSGNTGYFKFKLTTTNTYCNIVDIKIYLNECVQYTVNGVASPVAGGTVSVAESPLSVGNTTTVTATPNEGYQFTSWAVTGAGSTLSSTTDNPTTFTMGTADATVTATFTQVVTYDIDVDDQIVNGSISADKEHAAAGETVTLTATPNAGYELNEWEVVLDGSANPVNVTETSATTATFEMPASNVLVSATFTAKPTYAITKVVTPENTGTIETDATAWEGKSVLVLVEPETGYSLTNIVVGKTADLTVTTAITGNVTDGFTFTMPAYPVTVTATFATADVLTGSEVYAAIGTSHSSSYKAWELDKTYATYNGQSMDVEDYIQLRYKDETNNYSGIVTTASNGYVRKVELNFVNNTTAGRKLSVYGKNTAYSGPSDLYSAETRGTLLGEIVAGTNNSITVTGNYQYVGFLASGAIYFEPIIITWDPVTFYEVIFDEAQTGGTISVSPTTATESETITLTATPAEHYEFTSWIVKDEDENPIVVTGTNPATFEMPASDVTVEATFTALSQYDITIPAAIEDYIMVDATNNKAYAGETVTISVVDTPAGKVLSTLTVTGDTSGDEIEISPEVSASIDEYTFEMPAENVTINATFGDSPKYTVTFYVNGTLDNNLTIGNITPGSSIDLPTSSTLIPDGYSLVGWATEGSTVAVEDPYTPANSIALYSLLQDENAQITYSYVKVTESLADWSGDYLIVYTTGNLAFDGSLTTLDASGNTITVNITNNSIAANATTDASKFSIAKYDGGYSIKSASNKYIGNGSNSNGLTASDNQMKNTITYNNGDIDIVGTGGAYLRYNSSSGQERFRYFKSSSYTSQKAIQLYKRTANDVPSFNTITEVSGTTTIGDDIPTTTCVVVENGAVLTFNGENQGTAANLIIQDGGQVIVSNAGVQATMIKDIAVPTKDGVGNWYTISTPVNNIAITSVTNLVLAAPAVYDLYRYNESETNWENYKASHDGFNNLTNGRGYLYYNSTGSDLSFPGELNSGDVAIAVTKTGTGDLAGFNLIGNPYSHNIYKGAGTAIPNSKTEDYVLSTGFYTLSNEGAWTAGTDNSTAIKPGQGILVKATTAGTVTMTNTTANGAKRDNEFIKFIIANSQFEDVAYAMFNEEDGLNKINHRNASIPMLYIAQNEENYAIATMSEETQSFNLNFKAMTIGQYTLSYKAEGNYDYLHVIDRLTGEDVDMLLDGEYSFIASPSDNDARFIVRLGSNANGNAENDIFAYQNGNDIVVNGEGELQVFDMMGRMIATQHINGVQTVNMPSNGVYIFKLNEKTQKIVVR